MAQAPRRPTGAPATADRPFWSEELRALRKARGMTQAGWAARLGYGRATIRRWETGTAVPSAEAEAAILALCQEKGLFRGGHGALAGVHATPEWLADLLATARLDGRHGHPHVPPHRTAPRAPIQYALSGDVAIAYQVFGSGPIDLIITPGLISHREVDWEHPGAVRFNERLAAFARVIVFDKRGTGMSDRVAGATLEERTDDIRAVMDATGSQRAALFGDSEGGPMSILFAATYPERTAALLLYGTFARASRAADYPFGPPPEATQQWIDHIRRTWGTPDPSFLAVVGPSEADDHDLQAWWARHQRLSSSPGAFVALMRMNTAIDVRPLLSAIHVPTLVLHRTGDRGIVIDMGRHLAAGIPGARFVELPGVDHLPWLGDVDGITTEVAAFLAGARHASVVDRVLTTLLSVDLVNPTERGSLLGDTPWRWRLRSYDTAVRRELVRYRGRAMRTTGDRVLASFDGPARAVHCASAIRDVAQSLGLAVRAGVHTGEVELHGDDVCGPAVQVGAALAAVAVPGEVLVSGPVADLVLGSGLEFAERGTRPLDGVPGQWRLYAVSAG